MATTSEATPPRSRPAPPRASSTRVSKTTMAATPTPAADLPPSADIVGQLSFAPATKTTVVTTTTTTTTSFPPFVIKAPRLLQDRNVDEYPLAASPTPRAIKQLRFDIGGRQACFEEAEHATLKLQEFSRELDALKANNGSLLSAHSLSHPQKRLRPSPLSLTAPSGSATTHDDTASQASRTPISTSDAAELHSFLRTNRPSRRSAARQRAQKPTSDSDQEIPTSPLEPDNADASFEARTPSYESASAVSHPDADVDADADESLTRTTSTESSLGTDNPGARARGAAPAAISTASQRVASTDASLPSPRLSPITAAASLNRVPSLSRQPRALDTSVSSKAAPVQCSSPVEEEHQDDLPDSGSQTLSQIPEMLDTFDQMPDEMKTYVIYQFLRRCPKHTLQFVAEAVDPAMRCDFLVRLPFELSLNVLSFLDAKSMCRAAQVSKRWRHLVDSDERAWKALIEADGFRVSPLEYEKAISEGWGWQITGSNEELREIGKSAGDEPAKAALAVLPATTPTKQSSDITPRSSLKRKRGSRSALGQSAEKRRKKKASASHLLTEGLDALEKRQGPNAFASAAVAAVPSGIGLPSLQNLHFFKSIYQKHSVMRKRWMQPHSKPRHFAFKAHDSRVVTCLQFDDDKIITGSDDCNIDIFDTKTGAIRSRLRGHDGGVWALEYHGDLLVSGSTDRTVRIWDLRDGQMLHVFQGHTSTVRCLQILQPTKIGETRDGKPIIQPSQPLIITGSRDSNCRVWKLPKIGDRPVQDDPAGNAAANPYFLRALQGHSNSVRAIAAHGDTLVSGSYDTFVRAWKISTGECLFRLQGHTSKVYSVVLDHERNRCISGSMDYMVKVWSLESGTCLFNLSGHTSLVGLLDLRDDLLVSAAADATLRVWDPATGLCKHELAGHTGAITCFLHDGQKIISGSDKTLKLWDIETGECVRDLLTDLGSVWQIKFDERRCVAAVQHRESTYIEVIDFGECYEGRRSLSSHRGKRIVVDESGNETKEVTRSLRRDATSAAAADAADAADANDVQLLS